jgi:integrase
MNIDVRTRSKGTVYRACFGSGKDRRYKSFARKADAQRWLTQMQAELLGMGGTSQGSTHHSSVLSSAMAPLSFLDLFKLFQETYANLNQQPGTRRRETQIVKQYLHPYFGEKNAVIFTQADINQYLLMEVRAGKLKSSSINKHHQVIHKVFAWAVKRGLMTFNPASGISKLPTPDTVYGASYQFLEGGDLAKAIEKARSLYPKEFPVIFAAATTGMRMGELCALRKKDFIDSTANPVFVVQRTYCRAIRGFKDTNKSKKARVVPVSDQLLAVLKPLSGSKGPNVLLFFDTEEEARRIRETLLRKWQRVQKSCGITALNFHALRHTYATQFLTYGGNQFALQRILGHSNAKVTDKYSHFSQALMESSRNVIQIPAAIPAA